MSGAVDRRAVPPGAGPERPGAVEPRRDLVVDDERPVRPGQLVEHRQHVRAVDVHPAGALEHRFDDHGGHLVGVRGIQRTGLALPGDQLGVVGRPVEAAGRSWGEDVLGQHPAEERVHAADRVGHRHRRERVAVVAPADREEPGPRPPGREVPLQRHLHRDLDRHRARVGEEDVLEPVGGEVDEAPGEPDRRLVGQPAEHHVRHRAELAMGRVVELGHGIPVDRAPPRRHRVDDLTRPAVAVTQPQPDAVRRLHEVRVLGSERGGVRVPHVGAVERQQRLDVGGQDRRRRRWSGPVRCRGARGAQGRRGVIAAHCVGRPGSRVLGWPPGQPAEHRLRGVRRRRGRRPLAGEAAEQRAQLGVEPGRPGGRRRRLGTTSRHPRCRR